MAKNKRKKSKKIEELKRQNESLTQYVFNIQQKYSNYIEYIQNKVLYFFFLFALAGFLLGLLFASIPF